MSTTYQSYTCARVPHPPLNYFLPSWHSVLERLPQDSGNPPTLLVLDKWDRPVADLQATQGYLAVNEDQTASGS